MSDFTLFQLFLLQFFLIFLNAIFACAEIAVISINDAKLRRLSDEGNKQAKRLLSLTEQPAKFLATIQVGITLAGFLGSAFAADNFSDRVVNWLISLGVTMSVSKLDVLSVVVITFALSYITLILGELVPKRIAMQNAEKIGLIMSGPIFIIAKIFAPIVWFLTASTNTVLRLVGINPNQAPDNVGEEEIRIMVDAGSQCGTIDDSEKKMIHNIFEFDDKQAKKVMTHRLNVAFLNAEDDKKVWEKTMINTRFSIYPIYEGNIDNIIGTLRIKDYFKFQKSDKSLIIKKVLNPVQFIKESFHIDDLFAMMQKSHNHFSVVIDEYGGVQGIVTMNDLLEEIVGDLEDDNTLLPDQPLIKKIDENTFVIKGSTPIQDVSALLNVNIDSRYYDTFAGFLLNILGRIPVNESSIHITYQNLQIEVTSIKGRTIEEALVKKIEQ